MEHLGHAMNCSDVHLDADLAAHQAKSNMPPGRGCAPMIPRGGY
jgi:hypothetical protein